ncbi:CRE-ELPC-1 protein [Caenorhabditis remanei]|uniref:Elongator complex protein 1 n=1 Tax=Caenorhabditis remanei TaxID=31234 RepID=E3MXA0_CAERE|nr:CRE-ELPC-1 protein [Caenorhabditis remanei]
MKNLQIGRVKTFENLEITGSDEFAVHPILETIAVSTENELILLENDFQISSRINWAEQRRGFRTDGNQLVAVLADGRCLVIEDGEIMELEVAEPLNSEISGAEWSPDEQTLALADNKSIFLADSSLIPFVERSLTFSENEKKLAPMNVGWGSETTQFRGSEGKLKPGERIEKERMDIRQNSEKTEVHWRADGEIVAVSWFAGGLRNLTIFDRNGEIQNNVNIRNLYLSNCFAHRPNANLMCSAILKANSDDRIVFFERNGETRNSYIVKWGTNGEGEKKRIIERIEWNSTGNILAMQTAQEANRRLEFWHQSNYEFTRKYCWRFSDSVASINWKWSTVESGKLEILLGNGQFFSIHISPAPSFCDVISQNVVVASDELRMYSLCRRVVPPPMSDYSIQCLSDIVAFTTSSRHVHVITADWNIISFIQNTDNYKFNNDRASIDEVLHSEVTEGLICGFVYDEPTESFVIWVASHGKHIVCRVGDNFEILFEGESVGWIGVNPENSHVEIATNDGKFIDLMTREELFRIEQFDAVQVHFCKVTFQIFRRFYSIFMTESNHHVILSDTSKLFIDSSRVSQDAVSILTRGTSDILLIDFDNKLRFVDVETQKTLEDVRDVEAGCELVACAPESSNVILQAARGNLETIQPRRYVMAETREFLDRKEYISAFKWMKKHRIDMSFAMSYKGAELQKDMEFWIQKSTNDSQLLEQLLISCTQNFEEDGTALCSSVAQFISEMEDLEMKTQMFPLLLTALLRSKPARIQECLKEVQHHVQAVVDRKDVFTRHSLHHISFFVPAKELFNCALSTYDLKLAQQVAEASNYDPKEYLPVLNKLNRISDESEREYRINVVREAWLDAIRSLIILDEKIQKDSESPWFSDIREIIQRENLHQKALTLLNPGDKRYKEFCELYAAELERRVHWKEAALFYELAGAQEKCLKCWEMSRDVDGLQAAARRFSLDSGALKIHALKMSATLREARLPKELAKALKLAGSPSQQIVQVLCEANEWGEARREAGGELEILKVSVYGRQEQILTEISRRLEEFEKYKKRLAVVRDLKLKRVEQYAAGEVDDLRDDISVISSISSLRSSGSSKVSMASSVRRRKQIEKKKASLKEGGEYEDSALLMVLAENYRWTETVGSEFSG